MSAPAGDTPNDFDAMIDRARSLSMDSPTLSGTFDLSSDVFALWTCVATIADRLPGDASTESTAPQGSEAAAPEDVDPAGDDTWAIHRYPLSTMQCNSIIMPVGAKVLKVGEKGGRINIWALVNTSTTASMEARHFITLPTGQETILTAASAEAMVDHYLDTVITNGFVWHVFEAPSKRNNTKKGEM